MKSIKKRFLVALDEVVEAADDLALLSSNLTMLEPVQRTAATAKKACYLLANHAKQLHKHNFVEHMFGEPALMTLDKLVDTDVISEIEELFSDSMTDLGEHQLVDFVQQLLAKLEKHLLKLNTLIQQLGELLNEVESS